MRGTDDEPQLIRGLTLADTTALVIGTVIGWGVFLKTAVMTQEVGTPALVLAAWVAAGLDLRLLRGICGLKPYREARRGLAAPPVVARNGPTLRPEALD